jgi:hypothetical protein
MSDVREIGTRVECKKIGMRHTKDGHILYLAIHPDDTPHELLQDLLGQRYMTVFVRLNDEDEPVPSKSTQEGMRAIKIAATMCKDESFQNWLCINNLADDMSEESASIGLKEFLGIRSRSELKTNAEAREKFEGLRNDFIEDIRNNRI